MNISNNGLALISEFEGCRLEAYRCPAGVWTIGIGHTGTVDGKKISAGMTITKEKAQKLLDDSLENRYEPAVRKLGPMNQNQYDALVSFCYNLGPGIFKGSLLTAIQRGDWDDVARQMKLYNKATVNGEKVVLKGLTRRRNAEAELLLTPVKEEVKEVKHVVVQTKVEVNGRLRTVNAIKEGGQYFVKLRDLADDAICVDYDASKKIPTIKTKK